MRFVVNNVPVEVGPVAPDTTLLNYLRGVLQLTGTKEGCASGDCGACTVLVGSDGPGGRTYKTVNSCISTLGSVNNRHVLTVEGLETEQGLHPVQEAMITCHGSQCGFCTPGFVMSLAGLHESLYRAGPDVASGSTLELPSEELRHRVLDSISGNLCRCTGYRPIIEAGLQALEKPAQVINIVQKEVIDAPLAGNEVLPHTGGGYWQPDSEHALQALLKAHPNARLVAGGTDLMLESTQLYKPLEALIDLSQVPELTAIEISPDRITLGAAVTYTEMEQTLKEFSPELITMLGRLGSRQIRNRGTLGGNIANASPIADMPPYLLVLDAELLIRNNEGASRSEFLTDFYLDYKETTLFAGEYIAEVSVARKAFDQPLRLFKISKRYEDDISAVMGAFLWNDDHQLKIAYGGMAATPRRAMATEAFLSGQRWFDGTAVDEELVEQACTILRSEFNPMRDVRASASYRMEMACNLLRKACFELANERLGLVREQGVFHHA